MHGLGNDFVMFDARMPDHEIPMQAEARAQLAVRVAHRRFAVGADQIIFIDKPKSADTAAYIDMYNNDGSVVRACGNASRCVAWLLMEELGRDEIALGTISGTITCRRVQDRIISINMGPARLTWQEIPLAHELDTLHVPVGGYDAVCVNVGNPHAVTFVDDVSAVALETIGRGLEHDAVFPDRCNIEFVQVLNRQHVRMRVWERGVGITMACGTGACAVTIAAVRRGLTERWIKVSLDGGDLDIEWRETDNCVIMSGPVTLAYTGILEL